MRRYFELTTCNSTWAAEGGNRCPNSSTSLTQAPAEPPSCLQPWAPHAPALLPLEAIPGGNHADIAEAAPMGETQGATTQGGEGCTCSWSWPGQKLPGEGQMITELLPGAVGRLSAWCSTWEAAAELAAGSGGSPMQQLLWHVTCSIFSGWSIFFVLRFLPHQPQVNTSKTNPSALCFPFWPLPDWCVTAEHVSLRCSSLEIHGKE